MCFTTESFLEQASNLVLVGRLSRLFSLEKDRLYVGLYVRGSTPRMPQGEDEYHWAFLTGPKKHPKSGSAHVMYHAKEQLVIGGSPPRVKREWTYEHDTDRAAMLLVRVAVGKIHDHERLERIFREVPLRTEDPDWNCVRWMEDAFKSALRDGRALNTSVPDWSSVCHTAMWYVRRKKLAHRFDGKDKDIVYDPLKPPTWDMLRNIETAG